MELRWRALPAGSAIKRKCMSSLFQQLCLFYTHESNIKNTKYTNEMKLFIAITHVE